MKRKVKYKNFDRILTVALLGDYSQNVPKPKRTQVKMYLRGDKIFSSEVKTYPSGVKTYPVCSQNVPMIFVLLQFVYKLIEIMEKKKKNGYLKIFIHHYKNMFYIFKTKQNISIITFFFFFLIQ